jgi:hypothetical protein
MEELEYFESGDSEEMGPAESSFGASGDSSSYQSSSSSLLLSSGLGGGLGSHIGGNSNHLVDQYAPLVSVSSPLDPAVSSPNHELLLSGDPSSSHHSSNAYLMNHNMASSVGTSSSSLGASYPPSKPIGPIASSSSLRSPNSPSSPSSSSSPRSALLGKSPDSPSLIYRYAHDDDEEISFPSSHGPSDSSPTPTSATPSQSASAVASMISGLEEGSPTGQIDTEKQIHSSLPTTPPHSQSLLLADDDDLPINDTVYKKRKSPGFPADTQSEIPPNKRPKGPLPASSETVDTVM